jgi:hypothetical protein
VPHTTVCPFLRLLPLHPLHLLLLPLRLLLHFPLLIFVLPSSFYSSLVSVRRSEVRSQLDIVCT